MPAPLFCFATLSRLIVIAILTIPVASASETSEKYSAAQLDFFEVHVRPVLATHCYSCHSQLAEKLQAGLMIDRRDSMLSGGDSGPAIVPGDADASPLVAAIRYETYEMPPRGKLPQQDIDAIVSWINDGAAWPTEAELLVPSSKTNVFDLAARKAEHWAWQPLSDPVAPRTNEADWVNNDIDAFVLHSLEANGLSHAPTINKRGLLRRLSFDLTGLPPTHKDVEAFLSDDSINATSRAVDALLASPHFGERWGRHWLDLVRYSESRGHEFDADIPNAFQYRDYVIRALNEDIPYDLFVREQIAGDLIEAPRLNSATSFNESILGTGFWFLGEWVHSPVDIRKEESDRFDNMIDVMSKTFLGMTVACARCHDHKFDAISTRDYYSLSGFLQSSDYRQVAFESLRQNSDVAEKLYELDENYRSRIEQLVSPQDPAKSIEVSDLPDHFRVLVDYSNARPGDFSQDGFAFGPGVVRAGDAYLFETDGQAEIRFAEFSAARSDPFWNSLTNTTEPETRGSGVLDHVHRSGRTLRTPDFDLKTGDLFCEVTGDGAIVACVDSHRLISGPLHQETIVPFKVKTDSEDIPQWVRMSLGRYAGKRIHLEFTPAKDRDVSLLRVVEGAGGDIPPAREFAISKGATDKQLAPIASQWSRDRQVLKPSLLTTSPLALAMMDGCGVDDRVLIRGNVASPGDAVPRRFLAAIDGEEPLSMKSRSGRLELAGRITDSSNPLTARVFVNRVWHHLMGRGIVPTTDNFGVLGQRPTHPELLDHLASWFLRHGQSPKELIRYITQSQTYQMSGLVNAQSFQSDSTNIYWHYRPPKRLEAEVIRDALLAVAGELNPEPFGPGVPVHLTSFMEGRGRPAISGPIDGDHRRSIYAAVRRNFISSFMLAFDAPTPFSTMGRRNVSNVPSQALILMNDPLVASMADRWARRLPDESDAMRIKRMFEAAIARPASEDELAIIRQFLNAHQSDTDAWTQLAHGLFNTKEFIFLP